MEELSDPVEIGVAGAPHGIRGTLRVRAMGSGRHLRVGATPQIAGSRRRVTGVRETPKGFLVDIEGVADRREASALRGERLFLDRRELDAPDEGEVYVADLVGLQAMDDGGKSVGLVAETFETPAHEVLVIQAEAPGAADVYVPFTMEHVPEIDLERGSLTVRSPEG